MNTNRIPAYKDGSRHWWVDGWICSKCGLKKADLAVKTIVHPKKCVWCGKSFENKFEPCCAPDGDGHLWINNITSEVTK